MTQKPEVVKVHSTKFSRNNFLRTCSVLVFISIELKLTQMSYSFFKRYAKPSLCHNLSIMCNKKIFLNAIYVYNYLGY